MLFPITQEHLQRHSIIHRTDKVHRCPECGKGFNRKDHLTKHIHSHMAKRIKQELGQQPGKAGQQNNDNNSTINIQQHQSVLAHLHWEFSYACKSKQTFRRIGGRWPHSIQKWLNMFFFFFSILSNNLFEQLIHFCVIYLCFLMSCS